MKESFFHLTSSVIFWTFLWSFFCLQSFFCQLKKPFASRTFHSSKNSISIWAKNFGFLGIFVERRIKGRKKSSSNFAQDIRSKYSLLLASKMVIWRKFWRKIGHFEGKKCASGQNSLKSFLFRLNWNRKCYLF